MKTLFLSGPVATVAAIVFWASGARAQADAPRWYDSGIAADQLEPAPPGDPFFGVPGPFVGGNAIPRVSLAFSFAKRPLVLGDSCAVIAGQGCAVIAEQGFVRVGLSIAIVDRLLLSLELPVALLQSGEAPISNGVTYALPDPPIARAASFRPAVGDLRLGARVRVLGEDESPFQAALGLYLHIPSFMEGSNIRGPSVRATPQALIGGRYRSFVWSASLGAVLRDGDASSALSYGAGAAFVLGRDRLSLGAEVFAITPFRLDQVPVALTSSLERPPDTGAELLFSARLRLGSLVLGAAVGPGFGAAPGTPAYRVIGSLAFSPPPPEPPAPPPADTDEDGILDKDDACPYMSGVSSSNPKRHGCPMHDRDGDGTADEDDQCPLRAGPKEKGGCPPDRDGDGIADDIDLCPDVKGTAQTSGCPDQDSDGVPDSEDACPDKEGPWHADSKLNGCPAPPPAGEQQRGAQP